MLPVVTDLIRHGKHARAPTAPASAPAVSSEPAPSSSVSSKRQQDRHVAREPEHRQQRQAEDLANQAEIKQTSQQAATVQPVGGQTPHKEIAEFIVNEEREARSKLPTYAGLEDFELIEKMGE